MKQTPEILLQELLKHFTRTQASIERKTGFQPRIAVVTDHGKADQIGQWALRNFKCVQTYFACHEFRKAKLSIYLKP